MSTNRRDFLKKGIGAGTLAVSLPGLSSAQETVRTHQIYPEVFSDEFAASREPVLRRWGGLMAKTFRLLSAALAVWAALGGWVKAQSDEGPSPPQVLTAGWMIQSSSKVQAKPEILSTPAFTPQGWYATSVPSTVLAALVEKHVYPDPYFGLNMRLLPGTDYPVGTRITEDFANHAMPADSPCGKTIISPYCRGRNGRSRLVIAGRI